jgi:hypothetical protein
MNVRVNTFIGKSDFGRFAANIQTEEDIEQVAEDIKEFLREQLYEAEEDAI